MIKSRRDSEDAGLQSTAYFTVPAGLNLELLVLKWNLHALKHLECWCQHTRRLQLVLSRDVRCSEP